MNTKYIEMQNKGYFKEANKDVLISIAIIIAIFLMLVITDLMF